MTELKKYLYTMNLVDKTKKVQSVDIQFVVTDVEEGGSLNMTDLVFQEGSQVTAYQVNTKETLIPVNFNIDEYTFMNTVSNAVKDGAVQPVIHKNVTNRFYNFVGRGHQVLAIPNVFPEDYTQELVTTALDLTLYAKNDFDLLKISTNDGALVPDRMYTTDEAAPDHPLNYRYTREFYFIGALAEQEISLKSSIKVATRNGVQEPFSQGYIPVSGPKSIYVERQRLMGAPFGSFRLRVEFYSLVNGVFMDTGIGFWGIAEFKQYQQKRGVL